MELQLKNIGMIKEANVKIDGLTVIAGENDTGKSTLGKALYYGLDIIQRAHNQKDIQSILISTKIFDVDILFGKNVDFLEDAQINLIIEGQLINTKLGLGTSQNKIIEESKKIKYIPKVTFIETPIVWSFIDTFRNISQIGQQVGVEISHPYLMNDLSIKLSNRSIQQNITINIADKVKKIMKGTFKKDDRGIFYFEKNKKRIELINTATGIKSFGILQVLSNNGWLEVNNILVLDEPEVHLHPKWQLEMAKIIVELVKNGVKIVVNSHSPYMIEAFKRYSEVEKIEDKTNFYLAEDGYIKQIEKSNSQTLVAIYEKLSEPYDIFEEMESDRFQNG